MSGDLRAWDDLDLFGRETESDLEDLQQDVFHTLIEAPGSNLDAPNRGIGIEDALSAAFDAATGRALAANVEAGLRKDTRVRLARAQVSEVGKDSYRLDVEIDPDDVDEGPQLSFVVGRDGVRRLP